MLQDDEDSISELMVDKDKKSRFKLEKVGQVINIKSFLILALDLRLNVTKLLFPHFDEIVKIYQILVIFINQSIHFQTLDPLVESF